MPNFIHYAPEALWIPMVLCVIGALLSSIWMMTTFAIILIVLLLFYRGATLTAEMRNAPGDLLVAPCDGKLLRVVQHTNGQTQIAIFLNIHNIHVQYVPITGTITSVVHKPGEFHPAHLFEKSSLNERVETTFDTAIGVVRVVQIAGLIARRIVPFHPPNTYLHRLDPLGLIKFGSRVDLWVPTQSIRAFRISTEPGTRIHIGDPLIQV